MKVNSILLAALIIGSVIMSQAQDMEVSGTMKVKQMPVDNSEENLVVKKADGTLASRTLASLVGNSSSSDSTRSLQTDLEIVKLACSCSGSLPPFAIQRLMSAGYSKSDLVKSGISAIDIEMLEPVLDGDGNEYDWARIAQYVVLIKNLKSTKYMDGTPIPYAATAGEWAAAAANHTPAYCWPDGNMANGEEYGALYNYYALNYNFNGGKSVCPYGYNMEGGFPVASYAKSLGIEFWNSPNYINDGAINNILQITGSGTRDEAGVFSGFRDIGAYHHSVTPISISEYPNVYLFTSSTASGVLKNAYSETPPSRGEGYSLRCRRKAE